MRNLTAFIQFRARLHPDAIAVVYDDLRISYADLLDRALRAAGWLRQQGIGGGDVIALLMKNSPAMLDLAFAASHIGAVLLPVNFRLAAPEIAHILDDAGARILILDEAFSETAKGFSNVVTVNDDAQRDFRHLAGSADNPPILGRHGDDLYRLMYTSGTTDYPKGVIHSYDNFYWKSADQILALGISAREKLLIAGPLYHVGAFDLPGIAVLWAGGTMVILREFDAMTALGVIEAERITGVWFAPVMTNAVLSLPDRGRFDVSSLEWCIGGGERTPESRIIEFTDTFGNARYIDAYGLTESVGGDTFMEPGREIEKIGSTGRALAHVEVAIMDEEGRRAAPDTEGEICLRGPKITAGYWNDAAKTAASFHPENWFRTGDVGRLDGEGFLYLTDRTKDMIISGGENIASSEIERALYDMPEISEVAVVGRPDPHWGERVAAVVVPRADATLDFAAVDAHCRSRLAGFKVPRELHLVVELPRNPSGKVLKRVLRETLDPPAKND